MKKYYLFLILFFYYFSAQAQNKLFNLTGVQAAFNFGSDFVDDFNLSFNDIQKITPDNILLERNFGLDPSLRNHGRFGITTEVYAINTNLIFRPYNFNKKDYFQNFYFRFGLNYLTNRESTSYYGNSYFADQIKKNQSTNLILSNDEINLESFFFIDFAPIKKLKRTKLYAGFGISAGISVFNNLEILEREWDDTATFRAKNFYNYYLSNHYKTNSSYSFKAFIPVGISIGFFKKWSIYGELRKFYYRQRYFQSVPNLYPGDGLLRRQYMLSFGIQYDFK